MVLNPGRHRVRLLFLLPSATHVLLLSTRTTTHHAAAAFSIEQQRTITAKWVDLTDDVSPIVPPRSGHVAFAPTDQPTKLRVFGGYVEEVGAKGKLERRASNDMWSWNGIHTGWSRVEQQCPVEGGAASIQTLPRPRLASAVALVRDRPVLFGGWDPQTLGTGGVILDSLTEFDPQTNGWSKIDTKIPDGSCSRHVALSLPSGEALLHNHRCDDHVLLYSTVQLFTLFYGRFTKQPTTGTAPSSRGLHAATLAGDRYALFFGGAGQSGDMHNDAFVLDTTTWEWKEIQVDRNKPMPCPRAAPCLVAMSDDCAILFGGAEATETGLNPRADLWALHFDAEAGSGRWERIVDDRGGGDRAPSGGPNRKRPKWKGCRGPPPRNAATLSEIEYVKEAFDGTPLTEREIRKCFLLQGGWAPFQKTWNDNFLLSVSLKK